MYHTRPLALGPDSRIRRNTDVIAAGVASETILLDPSDWTYVHFNETAARIWEALDEPRTIANVIETLMRDYAVDRSTCEAEVGSFVAEMSRRGLIVIDASA